MKRIERIARTIVMRECELLRYPIYKCYGGEDTARLYILTKQEIRTMSPLCTLDLNELLPYHKVFFKVPMEIEDYEDRYNPKGITKSLDTHLELFAKTKNNSYIFPEALATTGTTSYAEAIGTFAEYIPGKNLHEEPFKGSFEELDNAIEVVKKDTVPLTNKHIKVYDLSPINTIWYNNQLKLVDCGDYEVAKKESISDIENTNNERINGLLVSIVKDAISQNHLNNTLREKLYLAETKFYQKKLTEKEYLQTVKKEITKKTKSEFTTFQEAKTILKLTKSYRQNNN